MQCPLCRTLVGSSYPNELFRASTVSFCRCFKVHPIHDWSQSSAIASDSNRPSVTQPDHANGIRQTIEHMRCIHPISFGGDKETTGSRLPTIIRVHMTFPLQFTQHPLRDSNPTCARAAYNVATSVTG
ncbi:unnamed protein product [Protopolystoma xenopodis]|uniref:Uncharacterized protein n=1 Tax=Protopolystoma xenopodis TaxID=117903 RepID=A0A3S5A322_9PLAT|nr:unnamed protein product [Protopolystoma xenopodis]